MVNFTTNEQNKIKNIIKNTVSKLSFLWKEEALDGDQTEWISKRLLKELDEVNANK